MAQYRDILPSRDGWIHDLARAEVHPEAERLLNLGKGQSPQQLLEESTVEFLTLLRENLTEYIQAFNSYSEAGNRFPEIKIYSLAQTPADFMIYRNQVKLVFANSAQGVVQISFAKHQRNSYSVDGSSQGTIRGAENPHELIAQMGPFREVFWTFQSREINAEQVARFYFTEFTKVTRSTKSDRKSNDALVDEIRSILRDRGLDL